MEYLHGFDIFSTFGGTSGFWPDSRPVLKGVVAQCPHMGRSSGKEMAAFLGSLATLVQMVEVVVSLHLYIFIYIPDLNFSYY